MTSQQVPASALEAFCREVLLRVGAPSPAAEVVAESLVDADLRGLDSHGVVARLPAYVQRVQKGGIVADAVVTRVDAGDGPVGVLDGADGFGQVAADAASALAERFARDHGVGVVSVRRSNHLGALGYYARRTAERGLVAYAASGGGPRIAPWGGAEPLLATNPWSYGFPVTGRSPMVVDVSNGVVLTGAVDGPAARGESIPLGWALDAAGRPTEDASAGAAGSLLAFGGVKGTSLTLALEALVSCFTGAASGPEVPS
ncbi:MAG TPA: Ldh family oxidoreductase, partial [Actinomycetales bacterium]|nr:Ldh family oxidoreductase [Actinomycetales bacterium]